MTLWWTLTGCGLLGGGASAPAGPDPDATSAAVDALCKLYEGAHVDCERSSGRATAGDDALGVSVTLYEVEESFGQVTWSGTVDVTLDGQTLSSRARGYGWSKEEAYERGFHEWALVAGVALVDWRLGDGRPALKAVEPEWTPESLTLGDRSVLRGWSLVRGLVDGGIDHADLLSRVAPVSGAMSPDAPHTLRIEVTHDMGEEPTWTCEIDAVPSDELCRLARTYPWPEGVMWEAKQLYLVLP
jgi:hypothetical protein